MSSCCLIVSELFALCLWLCEKFQLIIFFCTTCLCVLCFFFNCFVFFFPMYIVVYLLFVYKFTDHCHKIETELQLRNIASYHIISCIVQNHALSVETFNGLLTFQA